ncbi:MAG: metallophosphoesterase [bacterium]
MKVIAIGDLHGDFYKFKRILEETDTLGILEDDPNDINSIKINPKNIEDKIIIFIGDYVDWREEELENPLNLNKNQLITGTAKILKSINLIYNNSNLKYRFYFLTGNHEDMMFKALDFIINYYLKNKDNQNKEKELENLINMVLENPYKLIYDSPDPIFSEKYFNFLNWYFQGGKNTILSFNNLSNFFSNILNMNFFKELILSLKLKIEDELIIFAHSFPDDKEILIKYLNNLSEDEINYIDENLINQFLWSRRIWGIDAFNGKYTQPTQFEEIKDIFDNNKIKHFIVGHTKISKTTEPYYHFEGKIINIDLHGTPFSKPLILDNLNILFNNIKKLSYKNSLINSLYK